MNEKDTTGILLELEKVLIARKKAAATESYTATLYQGGHPAIADKISEEANEFIEAATTDDSSHIIHEAADLLFHIQVMLAHKDIPLNKVFAELESRFGTSGHQEKHQRKTK